MGVDILTLVTFFPIVGAILIALVPSGRADTIKGTALLVSFVTMLVSFALYALFDPVASGMQFEVNNPWVSALGINYHMGSDGIALLLILLMFREKTVRRLFSPSAVIKSFSSNAYFANLH